MGEPLEMEEHAAASLSGGLVNHGYQCGMLWGAALAAGAEAYRLYGPGPLAEVRSIVAAQKLVASFRNLAGKIDCREIIGLDMTGKMELLPLLRMLVTGKPVGCFFRAGRYAKLAFELINDACSGPDMEVPSAPVSCSAELARRVGASGLHATMAAGLAGGIGLSGGGCGALGAAVWLAVMKGRSQGLGDKTLAGLTGRLFTMFSNVAGSDFRCSTVTGRRFDTIAGHAACVRSGGCEAVIAALANVINGKEEA